MTKSGKLDRRITIEQRAVILNDFGEEIETWTTAGQLWAEKKHERATERFAAQQRYATAEVSFKVRWFPLIPTVTAALDDYRLFYEGREYNILGIDELGRREAAHIVCSSRTDKGGTPG